MWRAGMRIASALLLIGAASANLARQTTPDAPTGSLTFYTSRAAFDAAHPGIPLESFTNTNVPPDSELNCPSPFNSTTNNGCFSPGDILPGISVVNTPGGNLATVTPPHFGFNCVAVGRTFSPAENGELQFNPPVQAVGLDLRRTIPSPYIIEAFGPGGSLGSTSWPDVPFFGVDTSDPGGISRITFSAIFGDELFCNVAYGQPVPVDLQGFTVE